MSGEALGRAVRRFRDPRPPHELQGWLEDKVTAVCPPVMVGGRLTYSGVWRQHKVDYRVTVGFDAAAERENCYTLTVEATGVREPRSAVEGWLEYFLTGFPAAPPALPGEASEDRYREAVNQAIAHDAPLSSVASIQRLILESLRNGYQLSRAHKEGGTILKFVDGRFIRSDYGEWEDFREFAGDEEFLRFLLEFFHYPDDPESEVHRWRLIYRRLWRPGA